MTAEYQFVRVLDTLFEPKLKLRVTVSIPYQGNSNFEISIDHDPEIDEDRLTMPPPAWLVKSWTSANSAPAPKAVAFESDASRTLAKLPGSARNGESGVRFVMLHLSAGFANIARKVEAAVGMPAGGGYECLHQMLRAAADLPFWDEQVKLGTAEGERRGMAEPPAIGIYLERPLAEQLAANSSFSFSDVSGEDVLFASRLYISQTQLFVGRQW